MRPGVKRIAILTPHFLAARISSYGRPIQDEHIDYRSLGLRGPQPLCAQLRNIRDGKAKNYAVSGDLTLYEYDLNSTPEELDAYCRDADFVFNLAGVNRPQDPAEFMRGNFGFASTLLATLKKHGNTCR